MCLRSEEPRKCPGCRYNEFPGDGLKYASATNAAKLLSSKAPRPTRESTRIETNFGAETGRSSFLGGLRWQRSPQIVTERMSSSHAALQGLLVLREFTQDIGGSNEVPVVVEETLQSRSVLDQSNSRAADRGRRSSLPQLFVQGMNVEKV